MRGFYSGAELRELMDSIKWPEGEAYADMKAAYNAAFQDATRGTRVSDMLASGLGSPQVTYDATKQVPVDRAQYEILLRYMPSSFASYYGDIEDDRPGIAPYVQQIHSVRKDGLTFSTRAHSNRDSYVLVVDTDQDTPQRRAGQISNIFLHRRLENDQHVVSTFVVIDMFAALTAPDVIHDPFKTYPELDTRLYYNRSNCQLVVQLSDIVSHFAALVYTPEAIGRECIVCRSLDRVGKSSAFQVPRGLSVVQN